MTRYKREESQFMLMKFVLFLINNLNNNLAKEIGNNISMRVRII